MFACFGVIFFHLWHLYTNLSRACYINHYNTVACINVSQFSNLDDLGNKPKRQRSQSGGGWSYTEDKNLREAVKLFGQDKWSRHATAVKTRNGAYTMDLCII